MPKNSVLMTDVLAGWDEVMMGCNPLHSSQIITKHWERHWVRLFYFHIENVHCSCISPIFLYLLIIMPAFPSESQIANQYQVYFDKENLFVTICCVSSDNFVNSVKLFIPKTKMFRFLFGKFKACWLKNHLNALNCNTVSQ